MFYKSSNCLDSSGLSSSKAEDPKLNLTFLPRLTPAKVGLDIPAALCCLALCYFMATFDCDFGFGASEFISVFFSSSMCYSFMNGLFIASVLNLFSILKEASDIHVLGF